MPSTYNKLHRLKRLWTWEVFAEQYEVGPDIKTLKANYSQPHHKPNKNTVDVINQLYEKHFPSPFPPEVEQLMDVYELLYRDQGSREVEQAIDKVAQFVDYELSSCQSDDKLRSCRLNWLLGDIYFDKIINCRQKRLFERLIEAKTKAIAYYQQAIDFVEGDVDIADVEKYKLKQNIVACYLNATRSSDDNALDRETLEYLESALFLQSTKEVVEVEPFNWNIARNGLRFASLMRNKPHIEHFFKALVLANRRFKDVHYAPHETKAISNSKDFRWALQNVLTEDFLQQF